MPNNSWDAALNDLFQADDGSESFAESVTLGKAFDVVAKVEIGRNLNEFTTADRLDVTIENISSSQPLVPRQTLNRTLTPTSAQRNETLRIDIPDGWTASVGDVLQVTASYHAVAGVHSDFSAKQGGLFVVVPKN
ncbi:hypothetical protein ACIA8K_22355 [Catenuloplanes sp. NPDC051500]|uniref:hypothetical protein n=1 Tax=Catenuloplanes sp. NPDC051500 TaxID=3363959 RepID=UPI003790AE7F